MPATALIFDWDGTLVDSESANYLALKAALRTYGPPLSRAWFRRRVGLSSTDAVLAYADEHSVTLDVAAIVRHRNTFYLDNPGVVRPIEPILGIARDATHRGVPIAIATGGSRETVSATVARLGLSDLFPIMITRDDVLRGKPAPDLFVAALRALGASAADALVYEDSDEGPAAAATAGITAIDVGPIIGETKSC